MLVIKMFFFEKGCEVVDNGLQVLGGYGFCSDFVFQQYYCDICIFVIYEGIIGIQFLDLFGCKIMMCGGEVLQLFFIEMQVII